MKTSNPFAPRRGSPVPSPDVRTLVSIDPGNCTGWACWTQFKPHTLIACGVGAPPYEGAVKIAVEIPQAYPHSPVPYNDLITLAVLAGRYIGDYGKRGEAMQFHPHEWKGNLPKNVCENRCRMRLTSEELRVSALAEDEMPKTLHNNMWDAVGIGLVAFRGVKL